MEVNPDHLHGMRGKVWLDDEMARVVRAGLLVESTLPQFPHIHKTHVIGYDYSLNAAWFTIIMTLAYVTLRYVTLRYVTLRYVGIVGQLSETIRFSAKIS